ncbi:MAG: tetratricopeptide repeat protein [Opitutaceae bacterium]|nr:tetratricopeptide repeat protein [Opitutaceae bacterium]
MQPESLPPQLLNLLRQGMQALQQGRWEEAEVAWRRVLAGAPDFAELHNDHGNLLLNLNRPAEAEAALRRAVSLKNGYAPAWCNLGNALAALERRQEACEAYQRALSLDPGLSAARYNLGMSQLAQENFRDGWANYESRWLSEMAAQRRELPGRRWNGETPASGDVLLVHAEQGLGDTLQFCRFLPPALKAGFSRLVCEAPAPLVSLLRTSFAGEAIEVVAKGGQPVQAAWHCPMLSLPLALRAGVESPLPAIIPYLTPSQPARERWMARLPGDARRAGLVWSSNLRHKRGMHRVIGAAPVARALGGWEGEVYGLVKEVRPEDKVVASRWPDLGPLLTDFDETAAAVERMDLVVTVDTSVAHLAGALGRRTFILLPFGGDWRWFQRRQDSPWYPSVRLFRQKAPGDWSGVVSELAAAVAECGRSEKS